MPSSSPSTSSSSQRVFNQDNGNLFEYNYTIDYNFEYLGPALEPYAALFSPKTNETHPKFELYDPIERMVRAVNQTADAAFEGVMTQFLDLATFMKHVAVESSSPRTTDCSATPA